MPAVTQPTANPPARLLNNRNFILLCCAYLVSALGDHLSEIAILKSQGLLEPHVDKTPIFARMTFMLMVPFFLFGPFNGWLADRLPRRGVMITADVVRAAILLVFGSLIAWGESRIGPDWGPVAPMLLIGVFAALFSPARAALVPTLVKRTQLVRANGLIVGLGIIATMIAYVVGGLLAQRFDVRVAFWLDAGTFLASATLLGFLHPPPQHALRRVGSAANAVRQTLQGFRYARTHRAVREMLVIAAVVWFCGALVKSAIPAVVVDVYGGDIESVGFYLGFLGAGFIVGAAVMVILGNAARSEVFVIWGMFGVSASVAVFALSVFLPLSPGWLGAIGAAGIFGGGFFGVITMASFNALLQRIIPDRFRGRVFGVKDVCTTAALLLATGGLGIPQWTNLDAWVGWILAAVAVMTFATAAWALMTRFRRSQYPWLFQLMVDGNEFVVKFWWRLTVEGRRIPASGPTLVTANHVSYPDPLYIYASAPYRWLHFLVAAEYCHLPVIRVFISESRCIPVKRDGQDSGPTREVMRRLREGAAIGLFIEGRIVPPDQKPEPREGLAMLALRTGATVIPIHISGTTYSPKLIGSFLRRHRAHLNIGPPVDLSEFVGREKERTTLAEATQKIYAAIYALAPEGGGRHGGTEARRHGGRETGQIP